MVRDLETVTSIQNVRLFPFVNGWLAIREWNTCAPFFLIPRTSGLPPNVWNGAINADSIAPTSRYSSAETGSVPGQNRPIALSCRNST